MRNNLSFRVSSKNCAPKSVHLYRREFKRRNPFGLRLFVRALKLLRTLVNPRADQTDLLRRERLGAFWFGHKCVWVAHVCDTQNQIALGAVTGLDDRAIAVAFEHARKRVERQFSSLFW